MTGMDFAVEQPIAAGRDEVEAAFLDPDFYRALGEIPDIDPPEVLGRRDLNGVTELSVRYRFTGNLPSAARAVLDPSKLTWIQVSTIDLHAHRTDFHMQPQHYGKRLECGGSYRFEALLDGTTVQRVTGKVRVHWPVVGGAVERTIVNGLPGLLARIDGQLQSVVALHVADGLVRDIFVVANPDKLTSAAG